MESELYDNFVLIQYFDRVFSILSENCQVNGVDFAELISQNSTMEAVNNDLVTKLQEMQIENENLLSKTIEYRRQVPQIIKEAFASESGQAIEHVERELQSSIELRKEDLNLCNVDRSIKPNFYSNKLSSGLSHLTQLESVSNKPNIQQYINFLYISLYLVNS